MKTASKRPSYYHDAVKRLACERLLLDVVRWLGDNPYNEADVLCDLIRCVGRDGYEFARDLDRYGWSPDAELVEILDSVDLYGAVDALTREWVETNNIVVPFAIGDEVQLRGERAKIVDIKHDVARIVAQPLVPDGVSYGDRGGWVHSYEGAKTAP